MTELSMSEFVAVFDRFADSPTSRTVFRWEALQHYQVDYDEPSWVAHHTGAPRPERSVRTDEWLARIAGSTIAGKHWCRVRYVVVPHSEYTDWELLAHLETQAAGEQILVVLDTDVTLPDFWLFTGEHPSDNCAVLMHYDEAGIPISFEYRDDVGQLAILAEAEQVLRAAAIPLNDYLARCREVLGAH